MAVHISSAAQWRQILSSSSIVVTDFYADWCGPCKMIAPTFESLATKYSKPNRITFAKVDVDNQREVAQQYGVRAMPTFLILHNGSVVDTIQGANPPALTAAVEKAVKLATGAAMGAVFSSPGRTLGADTGSSRSSGGTAARRPSAGPIHGRAGWDLNGMVNALITFFGLYFTSLFSFDGYMAAQNSRFNVHNPTVPINTAFAPIRTAGSGGGSSAGTSSGKASGPARNPAQPRPTFKTLADLGKELQRACPRYQTWLRQVFESGVTAAAKRDGMQRRFSAAAASGRSRASFGRQVAQLRSFSTSRGAIRQQASDGGVSDAEEIEAVVRQARATFGDTLPKDYLTSQEYKLYERLYGSPLHDTRPEDVRITLQHQLDEGKHTLLRETDGGELEVVDYAVEGLQLRQDVDTEAVGQPLENTEVEYISAVVRNQREFNALQKLQRDFEAATLEAARNRSRTNPTTLQLPKAAFVEPISELLRRTDSKHIREAAEKVFGGRGLPHSPASPRGKIGAGQKAIPMEAGHRRMSEIEADTFISTVMPGVYATAMSALVEVRRRLGSGWIQGLLTKSNGSSLRVLDVGGGGAALAAWNEVLRSEVAALRERGAAPFDRTGFAEGEGERERRSSEKMVVVGSDALRHRISRFLHNTTFLPRLPDLLHSAANVERHLDAPASLQPRKTYDVIVASHMLMPLYKAYQRRSLVANLWAQLNPEGGVLIILEKGHPRGFEAVADARQRLLDDYILGPGQEEAAETQDTAEDEDEAVSSPRQRLREPGMIIAPCTTHGKCPMYLTPGIAAGRKDFCHFSQRFIRPPFLQKILGRSHRNHEDVDFSYVAVQRGKQNASAGLNDAIALQPLLQGREAADAAFAGYEQVEGGGDGEAAAVAPHPLSLPRTILAPLKRHGHVILDVCTPAGQLERWTVPRSLSRQAYHDARKARWGDLWALGAKTRVVRAARVGRAGAGGSGKPDKPRVIDVSVNATGIVGAAERERRSGERRSKKSRRLQERRDLLADLLED
ncbi:37S ribosomal protein rsm22 [Grosmannia clavigera kw1407]|uniref:37S ribosomal protein rsm22 n=1 Tax=Grosmannia clavigera (strain kw1407 / UAMH 11150) TaxID=655863 RepID=F0XK71_GROCL|nr:37S ribosomal protein rsm22 [Grosmannia clavigera kw1407]EFX01860.1 37S ribosomal protein rsm22 [Grosmannia clavigera kw1407]